MDVFERYMVDGNTVTITAKDGSVLTDACDDRTRAEFLAHWNAPVHVEFRTAVRFRPTRIGTMSSGGDVVHSAVYQVDA